jgi:peptide-methionine (S)-S-oxide reductase
MSEERAVLAGGCFWGMQDLIRKRPGVISTRVGYAGGKVPNATYRNHDGHAEAIEIIFDPEKLSFRTLWSSFSRFTTRQPSTGRATIAARATAPQSSTRTTSRKRLLRIRSPMLIRSSRRCRSAS